MVKVRNPQRLRKNTFNFKPFSTKQKKILTWWLADSPASYKDGIIADGAIRSGKTVSMALSFIIWAMDSYDNENFAMCGKTIGSFRRNVLLTLKTMLASRGYICTEHRTENLLEIENATAKNYFYIFGGKDESSQDLIQGITLAGVFFDEVALMPESFVNQATGRCSVAGSKFWFNCNPEGSFHWFKLNWIDKKDTKNLLYLHFTMEDNLSLSEKIKQRYRNMYAGIFYDRYICGLWKAAEGLIYEYFVQNEELFYVSKKDLPAFRYITLGVDWGGNKSKHGMQLTGITNDWKLYALRSKAIVATGTTPDDVFNSIQSFAEQGAKDFGIINQVYADCAEKILINGLRAKMNMPIHDSEKGLITDRIRAANMLMSTGNFYILKSENVELITALKSAVWDESKLEDVRLDDGSYSVDILDAWEYSWSHFIQRFTRR